MVLLLRRHPTWGLPRLRKEVAGLPKNATARYLRRVKRILTKRRRRNWRRLAWLVPNAVWAIDGTWLDRPVFGFTRRALVVVELCRRKLLALEPVPGERAAAVVALLRRLFALHGPPLVLKADNGSAFIAESVAELCREHGVALMHSPVRRPRWNGTCEVSGRWAKRRAEEAAERRGGGDLTREDLAAAVGPVLLGEPVAPELRDRFREALQVQLAAVVAEWGLAGSAELADHQRRTLGRVAAQRALLLCHILTIEGREYRQWLPKPAA